jgi:hypothetical protein
MSDSPDLGLVVGLTSLNAFGCEQLFVLTTGRAGNILQLAKCKLDKWKNRRENGSIIIGNQIVRRDSGVY